MEEIKIVIIILLSIISYAKLKNGQKKLQQLKNQQKARQQSPTSDHQNQHAMQQPIEQENYLITQNHIEEFAKIDKELIPKNKIKPAKSRDSSQMAPESRDSNDIFGGEYNKCMKGKTLDMDNIIIYNRQYFQRRIFSETRGPILTNQQQLKTISHLLEQPPQLYKSFISSSTLGNNSGLAQMVPDCSNRNTYNSFSFNINLEREAMRPEEDYQIDQLQDSSADHRRTKKKLIFKRPKMILRKKEKQCLQSAQKTKIGVPQRSRKRKTFICLQDQIKKKEQELELLKKLRQSQVK